MARRPRRLRCRVPGLVAAVLMLIGQIAIGAATRCETDTPLPAAFGTATVPICHVGAAESGVPAHQDHRGPDCALCPLCLAVAASVALLAPAPVSPVPSAFVAQCATLPPPARAPPPVAVLAATYPTGPPSLA